MRKSANYWHSVQRHRHHNPSAAGSQAAAGRPIAAGDIGEIGDTDDIDSHAPPKQGGPLEERKPATCAKAAAPHPPEQWCKICLPPLLGVHLVGALPLWENVEESPVTVDIEVARCYSGQVRPREGWVSDADPARSGARRLNKRIVEVK